MTFKLPIEYNHKTKPISKNIHEDINLLDKHNIYQHIFNTYTKVDESKCRLAISWWNDNNTKWSFVRNKWNSIYSKNEDISLNRTVKDKPLFSYLFDDKVIGKEEIGLIIDKFVVVK